jgi:hypothetical protein
MIKLKRLLEADSAPVNPQGQQPSAAQPQAPASQSSEYSPAFDFNDFENKLAQATEAAKNNFQEKLMQKVGGKKVLIRASKGYGQPKKDYTIDVAGVSIDYYYERYVIIFKDEKEKEYFLDTGMKIKILGAAEIKQPKNKVGSTAKPTPAPAPEPMPNVSTQGI